MTTTNEILLIRNKISKELSKIPDFINTKKQSDHDIWSQMLDLNYIITMLIRNEVLPQKSIDKIIVLFDSKIALLISKNDKQSFNITCYYIAVLQVIKELLIENELYESAENIKKFMNQYDDTNNEKTNSDYDF